MQCDELWSFVDNKGNKQWIWLALDTDTREIVGVYIGARFGGSSTAIVGVVATHLPRLVRLPTPISGQLTRRYFHASVQIAVGKETGLTSYIERFNNTLRQRVSRLVRKTLSFSKSLENHIGAIWYFIHHYNASLLL
jgi:insertion element IS1 protein InsB